MFLSYRFITILLGSLIFIVSTHGQQKKNLQPEDYGKWQSIGAVDISPGGDWIAYQLTVQEDNDTLYVKNRKTNQVYKMEFSSGAEFSKDNLWVAYRIGVSYKEREKLQETNKPVEFKMGLLNLVTGKKQVIQNVSRYGFSRNGKFLAVYLTPPKENKDKGAVLLLKNMDDSSSRTIGNVTEYSFNKKSDYLAYVVESANSAGNSVELFNLTNYSLKILASDTLKFSKLSWQKEGEALAFYKTFKKDTLEEENAVVYAYMGIYKMPALKIFDPAVMPNFPAGMRILPTSNLSISDDMSSVFFGINRWTAKPKKEDKKPADSVKAKTADTVKIAEKKAEKKDDKLAAVDIWHWKDREIQPRQKITYSQDKDFNYLSVWNLDLNNYFRLANEQADRAMLNGNQKFAIVMDDSKYKPAFKEDFADLLMVNAKTGEETKLFDKFIFSGGSFIQQYASPGGKYFTYFIDKHWWVYDIVQKKSTNLTTSIKTDFWNTRDDHPAAKPPFGFAGWIKDDKEFMVYDEYNTWAIKPDGSGSRKLSEGEKEEISFRLYRTDFEDPFIDDSKPIYFSAYGDKSKKFGYYSLEKGKMAPLIFEDKAINRLTKARDAGVFTFVKQDYDLSPELYLADNFANAVKVTGTNPQQNNYYWGKSELISFTNKKGKKMQGALFYPANYEPGKKYPMIVYIYEILSNTVHFYTNPAERSAYNTTNFTTQGYFIFRPDIVYDINDPGLSAVNCVVPAVEEVLKTGMIDKDKVGLMGHSWGAYQTSFIITQTDIFKAAIAGAPLTDLISMSLSIYWNSGTPDQKIFETSQGRFDGPWYDRMQEHMRNSPMFEANKIKAPLLVAFGDKDGAVDWHQGIEMYGTMRRMEKPHVMLVYADENHGLAKKENQVDYQRRQKEWFEHYLLGKPAAKWITEGTSYLEKMKEREKTDNKTQQ